MAMDILRHLTMLLWTLKTGLLMMTSQVGGYPGGAPIMSCGDMFPSGHGALPQTSTSPYKIQVPQKKYDPNTTIKISLVSTVGYFRGVFVQARRVGCHVNYTQIVGSFTINDNDLETQHCLGNIHSAVTHKSSWKKFNKDIYWTPPVNPAGHVVIRATFVMERQMFWVDVESDVLVDLQEMDTPKCLHTTVRPIPAFTNTPSPRHVDDHLSENVLGKYSSRGCAQEMKTLIFELCMFLQLVCILTQP